MIFPDQYEISWGGMIGVLWNTVSFNIGTPLLIVPLIRGILGGRGTSKVTNVSLLVCLYEHFLLMLGMTTFLKSKVKKWLNNKLLEQMLSIYKKKKEKEQKIMKPLYNITNI